METWKHGKLWDQGRNSHDAGKRFLLADELKSNMTLDDALVKRVAGGPQEYVTGRMFNSGDRFSFLWQAGIVLAFNENDCPKFDAADAALLARMLVVPMRSKFVTDHAQVDRDELTFLMDADMLERSAAWMPAVLDVLREHIDMLAVLHAPPPSMSEWKQELSDASNPVAEWMERAIRITGNPADVSSLGLIYLAATTAPDGPRVQKKLFFSFAKAFLASRNFTVNPRTERVSIGNAPSTVVTNVVRGVSFV